MAGQRRLVSSLRDGRAAARAVPLAARWSSRGGSRGSKILSGGRGDGCGAARHGGPAGEPGLRASTCERNFRVSPVGVVNADCHCDPICVLSGARRVGSPQRRGRLRGRAARSAGVAYASLCDCVGLCPAGVGAAAHGHDGRRSSGRVRGRVSASLAFGSRRSRTPAAVRERLTFIESRRSHRYTQHLHRTHAGVAVGSSRAAPPPRRGRGGAGAAGRGRPPGRARSESCRTQCRVPWR